MKQALWDFEYCTVSPGYEGAEKQIDVVVALSAPAPEAHLAEALREVGAEPRIETLLARAPLFWVRVTFATPTSQETIQRTLDANGMSVRYVTSAVRGSLALGQPADFDAAEPARPTDWAVRGESSHAEPRSDARWLFYEAGGVDVNRSLCGTGAGTRLAVIDDEARDADTLPLDREVHVGTSTPSRSALHGSLMVAWAVGGRGALERGIPAYTGAAPDASPRLYLIPKPGREVTSLPRALVLAVDAGADVVVCATHIEGVTSPLLDDALAFASRLGRNGKGTAVVVPTGREISSPQRSVHASLTLHLGDPASDPRVLCVAPSGRDGGWFLWTDKRGKLRPFANRGPSVRVSAPGDDMSYPFTRGERVGHAESSGASAIAAGVALLVLGTNPELSADQLYDVLSRTASIPSAMRSGVLADAADALPEQRDTDGHDAKCGYGRVSAARACVAVADPFASALVVMGEEAAARRYLAMQAAHAPYSRGLARWAARLVHGDPALSHAVRVVVRHLRLVAGDGQRRLSQPAAVVARQLALVAERLSRSGPPSPLAAEVTALERRARAASRDAGAAAGLEAWCFSLATALFKPAPGPTATDGGDAVAPPVGALGRSA